MSDRSLTSDCVQGRCCIRAPSHLYSDGGTGVHVATGCRVECAGCRIAIGVLPRSHYKILLMHVLQSNTRHCKIYQHY